MANLIFYSHSLSGARLSCFLICKLNVISKQVGLYCAVVPACPSRSNSGELNLSFAKPAESMLEMLLTSLSSDDRGADRPCILTEVHRSVAQGMFLPAVAV